MALSTSSSNKSINKTVNTAKKISKSLAKYNLTGKTKAERGGK